MKKIIVLAMALAIALFAGCGRRNTSPAAQSGTAEAHDHSACDNNHDHDHDHSSGAKSEHNHAPGETCTDDHESHSQDAQDGHDHTGHSHEGDDHSTKNSKKQAEYDPHAGHDHGSEEAAADPEEIVFPASQAARTEFEVLPAGRGTFSEVIRCGGRISSAQNELTVVVAPVAGIVTPFDGRVMASTPVKRGQELFTLTSDGLASGDAVNKARINFEQAKANFERVKALYDDKLVTQRDYLDAQAQYLTAQAEYEPVRQGDGRGGTIISAPASGYIAQMSVTAGDFVEMGTPLATIARSGRMQLTALVSQRYFDRLARISDANFTTPSSGVFHNVKKLNGSLYNTGRIVSSGSALIPVVFEMDNNGTLPDGAYVEVALLSQQRQGVLTLPLSAVTEQQGLYYVYVQLDEECYSRREVRLGTDNGINVEILSGLEEGDPVVTKGAINVKMAAASGAIPHGHTH